MKLVHWIFAACLITASCDTILNFHIGGSLRFCQVLMILVCIAAMARMLQDGRVLWPDGATPLSIWVFTQFLFLPFCGDLALGLQFSLLLLFTVFGVFAAVQIYALSDYMERLMKIYMMSYVVLAIFGLIQFVMPLLGLPGLPVAQWIQHGKLARINGFSYEPSYYATYMTMGWIMLIELRLSRARIAAGRRWKWATVIITMALFLSTSKTAWVFMILELLARAFPGAVRAMRSTVRQLRVGQLKVPLPRQVAVLSTVIALVLVILGARALTNFINPTIFLSGTGLANTPAHSYNDRFNAGSRTWAAFEDHPFVGHTLGGVAMYIASRDGIEVTNIDALRAFEGFPVFLEVLVASGIIGFIPFAMFVYAGTAGAFKLAKLHWPGERARWLRALARAMVFEWLILLTDQNLLRVYVWFHITMVAVVAYNLEFAPSPLAVEAALRRHDGQLHDDQLHDARPIAGPALGAGGATAAL